MNRLRLVTTCEHVRVRLSVCVGDQFFLRQESGSVLSPVLVQRFPPLTFLHDNSPHITRLRKVLCFIFTGCSSTGSFNCLFVSHNKFVKSVP